jgi:hypothetical protein
VLGPPRSLEEEELQLAMALNASLMGVEAQQAVEVFMDGLDRSSANNYRCNALLPGVTWDLADVEDFTKAWEKAKPVGIQETEEDDEEAIKKKAALAEAARVKAVADAEESKKQAAKAAEEKKIAAAISADDHAEFGALFNTSEGKV